MLKPEDITSAPVPPTPTVPVASQAPAKTSPYDSSNLGENKQNLLGSVAAGLLKPIVQTGVSLVDPFTYAFGKEFKIKSDFLGGADDGYVYSFLGQTERRSQKLAERYKSGEISFAKGLVGSLAAANEPVLDLATLAYGGGAVKGAIKSGGRFVLKDLVTTSLRESLKRGGAIAGTYDVLSQLQEAGDYNAMRTVGAVAAGTALDLGVTKGFHGLGLAIGKGGELVFKAVPEPVKSTARKIGKSISDSKFSELATTAFGNKEILLKKKFGATGEKVVDLFKRAQTKMNDDVGKFQRGLIELGLIKAPVGTRRFFPSASTRWADREFRFDVRDALGKVGKFADPTYYKEALKRDPELAKIVDFFDGYRKNKGLLGQQLNIVENLEDIDTYFSRYTPHVELRGRIARQLEGATTDAEREAIYAANSEAVTEMIDYGFTREGKWNSRLEGFKTYYDAMDVSLKTGRVADNENAYFQWLVKNGHASSIAEAKKIFVKDLDNRQLSLTPRIASFDYERQVPLPWNDPDPVRVMTKYIEDTDKRIAYAEQFGANDEVIKGIINEVRDATDLKDAKKLETIFRRLTGQVERSPEADRLASLLTNVETLKLVKSAVMNIPQALLYSIPTDFRALGAGLKAIASKQNIIESLDRGIYLSDLARQTRALSKLDQKLADNVMQYSGFGHLDMLIKSMGSAVADDWTRRTLSSLEKKLGITLTEVEREGFVQSAAKERAFKGEALRGGYKIQQEAVKLFNKEFKGEDFVAVAGQQGRARAYLDALDSIEKREVARLEKIQGQFEKSLLSEGKQFTSQEDEVQALVSEIKEIKESISIYEGGKEVAPAGVEEQFSERQVEEGLAEAKRLLIENLNTRIEELTGRFDEASAVGMVEGQTFAVPRVRGKQRVAKLNEQLKKVKDSIEKAKASFARKKDILSKIADSYKLSGETLAAKNPDVINYRVSQEARKAEFSQKGLSQYQEYHYLKELGLDPEEILARGHLTEDDLARATQSLVEQTQGSNNPLLTPLFAEHPYGKIFYQFKKITLQQGIFFGKQIKRSMISKDTRSWGNAARFLTVAFGLYPPTMGVIKDLRDVATGKKNLDETFEFDKYWGDFNYLAATGLFLDFTKSFERGNELDFLSPVVLSDAVKYMSGIVRVAGGIPTADEEQIMKALNDLYKQAVRQTGVGDVLLNYLKKD